MWRAAAGVAAERCQEEEAARRRWCDLRMELVRPRTGMVRCDCMCCMR